MTAPPLWYGEMAAAELEALVSSDQLVQALRVKLGAYLEDELAPGRAEVPVRKIEAWLQSGGKSPNEQALKIRLRELLDG